MGHWTESIHLSANGDFFLRMLENQAIEQLKGWPAESNTESWKKTQKNWKLYTY